MDFRPRAEESTKSRGMGMGKPERGGGHRLVWLEQRDREEEGIRTDGD